MTICFEGFFDCVLLIVICFDGINCCLQLISKVICKVDYPIIVSNEGRLSMISEKRGAKDTQRDIQTPRSKIKYQHQDIVKSGKTKKYLFVNVSTKILLK